MFVLDLDSSGFFFFNDSATTEIYTLSLHDALPIWPWRARCMRELMHACMHGAAAVESAERRDRARSEEHTSELQSHLNLVCRLLLEKKKNYCDGQFPWNEDNHSVLRDA